MNKKSSLLLLTAVKAQEELYLDPQNQYAHEIVSYNQVKSSQGSNFLGYEAADKPEPWFEGLYYSVPTFEIEPDGFTFHVRKPEDVPKKPEGKKRIVMMGDSLMTDDVDWGWSHHFAYKVGKEKLPFDVVNLSRSGATITWAAHWIDHHPGYGCLYPKDTPLAKEWITWKYNYMEHWGKQRWDLGATVGADYVVLQIGANDAAPSCMMSFAWDKSLPGYDPSLEDMLWPSCFWAGMANEDAMYAKLKEGLTKMVTTAKGWESKPQVVLVTPPPVLGCCPYPSWKGLVHKAVQHFAKKLITVFEQVAKETDSKLLNMHEVYKDKPEQELCDNQKWAINPHEGLEPNFCNPIHWGRPEIIKGLDEILLKPETAKIRGES